MHSPLAGYLRPPYSTIRPSLLTAARPKNAFSSNWRCMLCFSGLQKRNTNVCTHLRDLLAVLFSLKIQKVKRLSTTARAFSVHNMSVGTGARPKTRNIDPESVFNKRQRFSDKKKENCTLFTRQTKIKQRDIYQNASHFWADSTTTAGVHGARKYLGRNDVKPSVTSQEWRSP